MKRLSRIRIGGAGAFLLACFILLSGCGGIVSSRQMTTTSTIMDPSPAEAYYFLPLVKIRLIAERKSAPAGQKISKEQDSKSATSEPNETGNTTKKPTEHTSETTNITTSGTIPETGCTLTLKETPAEPDPRYMFSLSHLTDIFADDQVTITIGGNGLLAKVSTTSEGKAGQVVLKVAELAKEIMKASAGLPTGAKALDRERFDLEKGPFQYEVILDPTDVEAVKDFNSYLDRRACNFLVTVQAPKIASIAANQDNPHNAVRNGIFYRPALPYVITFKTKEESKARVGIRTDQTIYLPNAAPVLAFDIKRPSFVKFTQTIEFENGMLKGSSITKPSEALGFVSIPVDLAKSIAAIPSELFKFRVETIQGESGVLEAQQKLLEAQRQLLEKQEELRRAQEEAQGREVGQLQP